MLPGACPSTPTSQATSAPPSSSSSDLVDLNVGGTLFTTSRATLEDGQPQSMLAALVGGRHGPPRRDTKVGCLLVGGCWVLGAECVWGEVRV